MHYFIRSQRHALRMSVCATIVFVFAVANAVGQSQTQAPDTTWRNAWRTEKEQKENRPGGGAKLWHVWFRAGTTFSLPFGDYFDGITSGVGFEGDMAVAVTPQVSLRFLVGKTGIKAEDNLSILGVGGFGPEYTVEREEVKASAMRYMLGFQFNQMQSKSTGRGNMWYVYDGLGVVVVKPKATAWVRDNTTGDLLVATAEDSQTRFAMSFGGGYVVVPNSRFGIDLGANMDFVWTKRYTNSGAETAGISGYILDLKAGLVFFL